jgi:F-type H+-transporting ATPase subunit b
MQKAIEEGKRISQEIQQKAREDAEALLERAKQNAEIELANARKQLRKDVVELTLAATEKVLREKIDRTAHQRHIDTFIDELGGLQ